tara:strand:- start:20326 stop:20799 length:474 start_codon:yes stop_codon:yes gene_type:complete
MHREQVIIMIDRLVKGQGGDVATLKRYLKIAQGKKAETVQGRWWIPILILGYVVLLGIESQLAVGSASEFLNIDVIHFPGWIWYVIIPVQSIPIIWLAYKYGRKIIRDPDRNKYGMAYKCVTCKYDLSGLDSILDDELWVGPAMCPKCGQDFPAVGE